MLKPKTIEKKQVTKVFGINMVIPLTVANIPKPAEKGWKKKDLRSIFIPIFRCIDRMLRIAIQKKPKT